ncbi:SDR family oxidoreductase [Streptomyces sp. NPDC001985]|uniref:SDR family oxidoreductase n=1 Tax=Streptomyces sp. NPDC001985 TaxID=3154406 RepID=UPI0033328000
MSTRGTTSDGRLSGKTALVTGGSRGIGRGIAERLGRDGARVAVHYGGNEAAAKETVAAIEAAGGSAFALGQELGIEGDAAALWAEYDRLTGSAGVDIVINNAGIAKPDPFTEISEQTYDRYFAVNTKAPFFVVREGLSRLRDGGRVINISSGLARVGQMPEMIAYAMTKAALDAFSLNLSKVLGPRGITVNSLAPGVIDTDMNAWLHDSDEIWAGEAARAALGRVGTAGDIADAVAFLASDDGRWVTGAWLDVSGGTMP